MQISGNPNSIPSLNLVGDMSSIKNRRSNLIFVYPLLFDKTLIAKWEGLIRDFQTAQFISQIKISNVLNITQSAVQGYGQSAGSNYINPAEILNNALSNSNSDTYSNALQQQLNKVQSEQFSKMQRSSYTPSSTEYLYKINEYRSFIKQQIQTDPLYSNLRPAFSIITVENNLIDVPLIIGTKTLKIDTGALYWILFVALSNNETGLSNISKTLDTIDKIPKGKYLELLYGANIIRGVPPKDETAIDKMYNTLRRESNAALSKAIRDFNTVTGSLSNFEKEIGFGTSIDDSSASYTKVMADNIAQTADMKTKVATLINQSIISTVFPAIQTINNLVVNPAMEVDYNSRYGKLLSIISGEIGTQATTIVDLFSSKLSNSQSQSDYIDVIKSNCNALHSMNSFKLLDDLNRSRLKFSQIRTDANSSNLKVIDFAEELNTVASALHTQAYSLRSMIHNITDGAISTAANMDIHSVNDNLITTLESHIRNYFYDSNATDTNIVDLGDNPAASISRLFSSLFKNASINDLRKFMDNSIRSLARIVNFLFLYSTVSYFCEMINIVSTKIEIAKKDVVKFPNYTLVIPIEYVTTLYYALAARNTVEAIRNMEGERKFTNFRITETEIMRIIDAIIDRLNVSNIVIIDSNKKEIYYRWSYLKRTIKLNESTLNSYIRSQSNITSAF